MLLSGGFILSYQILRAYGYQLGLLRDAEKQLKSAIKQCPMVETYHELAKVTEPILTAGPDSSITLRFISNWISLV